MTFKNLPATAPDDPVTVLAKKFESAPVQKSLAGRMIDIINEIQNKQHAAAS